MLREFRLRPLLAAAFASAALLVLSPALAHGTVVVPLTREALVAQSDLVVRCTVLARKSGWSADGSQLQTWTTLRVDEYLKGSGKRELVLRQLGGEVDGLVSEVAGDAHVLPGEQAVLFLRRGEGVVFLTALAQAAYLIHPKDDGVLFVERDLHGLSFARWVGPKMKVIEAAQEPREKLSDLVRSIRGLAGKAARP